jgi:hypothetical protein
MMTGVLALPAPRPLLHAADPPTGVLPETDWRGGGGAIRPQPARFKTDILAILERRDEFH